MHPLLQALIRFVLSLSLSAKYCLPEISLGYLRPQHHAHPLLLFKEESHPESEVG